MRYTFALLCVFTTLITAGCGFHLRGATQISSELKTLILESSDPYGPLTRVIRQQLRLNDVSVIDNPGLRSDIPSLRLQKESRHRNTASIFRNGRTAEYLMMLTVSAQVLLPNKEIYPISATVEHSFFDNPQAALAKDSEQEIIIQDMREKAAEQLIRKLLSVSSAQKKRNNLAKNQNTETLAPTVPEGEQTDDE